MVENVLFQGAIECIHVIIRIRGLDLHGNDEALEIQKCRDVFVPSFFVPDDCLVREHARVAGMGGQEIIAPWKSTFSITPPWFSG